MTGIYKKFKSGTDIRGIGIGNGDEPLYMSDGFISKASAAFADFLSEKTGKAADKLTVAIGHDPRLSAGRISAAVVRGLALRGVNIVDCSLSSTPAMFMAVLDLPCDGSVQMTASHHPGDRNGLKFSPSTADSIRPISLTYSKSGEYRTRRCSYKNNRM